MVGCPVKTKDGAMWRIIAAKVPRGEGDRMTNKHWKGVGLKKNVKLVYIVSMP